MSAPLKNKNAVGGRGGYGKSLQNRKLAAKVRTFALKEIYNVLKTGQTEGNKDLYRAVLIRLAGNVLPRLNEHTGEDGEQLFPNGLFDFTKQNGQQNRTNNSDQQDKSNEEEDKDLPGGDISE